MKTVIHVPIEPLTERYSEQWYRNFPIAFREAGFDVLTIGGRPLIDNDIKVGAFLDINSTVHYKMAQLQAISAMFNRGDIENGTVFFFGDVEFWGLESVRLMAQMNNVDVKLTGFLHAASYTIEDAFAVAAPYQQYTEVGWIAALDAVFVGSEYHKKAVIERRLKPVGAEALGERIHVTKNPLFLNEYHKSYTPRKRKVILSNRFDPEKRPGETLDLFARLHAEIKDWTGDDWEFVVVTGRKSFRGAPEDMAKLTAMHNAGIITAKAGLTKEQYHRELAESYMMVSHSVEENYGYCIAEALYYGCLPLLREGLSHDEFVSAVTFKTGEDFDKAIMLMAAFDDPPPVCAPDASGMYNIINRIKDLTL